MPYLRDVNYELLIGLNICKRTLQYYRKSEFLPSSQIAGKVYFKASDVQKVLEKNYSK